MESVLLVTSSESSIPLFTDLLSKTPFREIVTAQNCASARRLLIERDFDLYIINAPLRDELGDTFAASLAAKGICQVFLIVKNELLDEISVQMEEHGVFTLAKPINKDVFWSALKLANASFNKMLHFQKENAKLVQKIDDMRLVDRAKCILIQYLNMSETEAHRYIEKQAMDMRLTRKAVANRILQTYER